MGKRERERSERKMKEIVKMDSSTANIFRAIRIFERKRNITRERERRVEETHFHRYVSKSRTLLGYIQDEIHLMKLSSPSSPFIVLSLLLSLFLSLVREFVFCFHLNQPKTVIYFLVTILVTNTSVSRSG